MEETYFQSSERVRVIEEQERVVIIEDLQTKNIKYLDKRAFHEQYEAMFNGDDYLNLKAHIQALNEQMKHLRRANSKQKNEIRSLRKEREKVRKAQASTQHYKNGKRGTIKNG